MRAFDAQLEIFLSGLFSIFLARMEKDFILNGKYCTWKKTFGWIDRVCPVKYERARNPVEVTGILFELTTFLVNSNNCELRSTGGISSTRTEL